VGVCGLGGGAGVRRGRAPGCFWYNVGGVVVLFVGRTGCDPRFFRWCLCGALAVCGGCVMVSVCVKLGSTVECVWGLALGVEVTHGWNCMVWVMGCGVVHGGVVHSWFGPGGMLNGGTSSFQLGGVVEALGRLPGVLWSCGSSVRFCVFVVCCRSCCYVPS